MTNPIKFRVWSKSQSKWMSNIVVSAEGTPILLYSEKVDTRVFHRVFLIDVYEPVVQYSIGVKDATGLEIYEGDILKDGGEVKRGQIGTVIGYLDDQIIGNIFQNAATPTEEQPITEEKKDDPTL